MGSRDIVVFLKSVVDNTRLKIGPDGPVLQGAERMMNPYDEYALETGIRLKEAAGEGSTLTALSLGDTATRDMLKKAIAAGADQAVLVETPEASGWDAPTRAFVLAQAAKHVASDAAVLLFGQTSLDGMDGLTGPMVAEILDRPSVGYVKAAEWTESGLIVSKDSELGLERLQVVVPAVLCVMKCDYELRGSNIKGVMKANKATIPSLTLAELSVNTVAPGASIGKVYARPGKSEGKKVAPDSTAQAVDGLMTYLADAGVI
jgi:electron transfer flavoprotein beta subunit